MGGFLKRLPDRRSKDVIHGLRKHMAGLLLLSQMNQRALKGPSSTDAIPLPFGKCAPQMELSSLVNTANQVAHEEPAPT